MPNYRAYLPAAVLLVGCGFVLRTHSQAAIPLARPLGAALEGLGTGYRAEDKFLSEEERRVAGMSSYVARVYWQDSSLAFTTFVSYYERQSQGKTIHSPRNCLPGAGWEVLRAGTTVVQAEGVPYEVNRYILRNGPETAVAYYWYQGRGRVVANEYRVKWNLLRDAAVMGHTEESLARIVVPVRPIAGADSAAIEASYAAAYKMADRLAGQVIVGLRRALPADSHPAESRSASATRPRREIVGA